MTNRSLLPLPAGAHLAATQLVALPLDVRAEVDRWSRALSAPEQPIGPWLARVAAELGSSPATARRNWDKFRKGGASALINRAKAPQLAARSVGLHPDTLEHWRSLCERNKRKCKPAHRELVRQWFAGEPIPGVDPSISRARLRRGFSYENLMRFAPTPFERAAARVGRATASAYRPQVLTTRVGLQVGRFYQFDDVWHDFKVVVFGQAEPRRLLQLSAFDLFSACNFARGLKPRIEHPESGRSVNLNDGDMLFLLAHVLEHYGYHPDGCTMMVELGTAKIDQDTERALYEVTGGKVTVARPGVVTAPAFDGQFPGRAKGNFRFKAAIESWHNPLHNETAHLLGQTGSNSRLNEPEEMMARDAHTRAIIAAAAAMPPELAAELAHEYIEANRAIQLANTLCELLNQRTDHDLEGWLQAGLTAVEYRLPGDGKLSETQLQALDAARRQAVLAVAEPVVRKLSPREVFDAGRRQLVKLNSRQVATLMLGRAAREVKVRNHLLEFQDANISPEPLRYLAHTYVEGETYHVVVNPFATETAHLFDAKGAWQGTVREWQRASRDDTEALHAMMGQAAQIEKQLRAPLARRGAAITRDRLANALNNIAVLTEAKKLLASDSPAPRTAGFQPAVSQASSLPTSPASLAPDPDLDALLAPAADTAVRSTDRRSDSEVDDFLTAVTAPNH